jgi:hypothetical protein
MRPPLDTDQAPSGLENSEFDELEDEENDVGGTFQALLDDVLDSDLPFYEEDDEREPDSDDESDSEPKDELNPTVQALKYLAQAGLTVSVLLDNIVFGDESIQAEPTIKAARTALFKSSAIPHMLDRIRKPPHMRIQGIAHKEAKAEIETWALETTTGILRKELVQYTTTTKAPETETEVVNEESLKDMTFDVLLQQIELHAPRLKTLLSDICMATRRNRTRKRNSEFVRNLNSGWLSI